MKIIFGIYAIAALIFIMTILVLVSTIFPTPIQQIIGFNLFTKTNESDDSKQLIIAPNFTLPSTTGENIWKR